MRLEEPKSLGAALALYKVMACWSRGCLWSVPKALNPRPETVFLNPPQASLALNLPSVAPCALKPTSAQSQSLHVLFALASPLGGSRVRISRVLSALSKVISIVTMQIPVQFIISTVTMLIINYP